LEQDDKIIGFALISLVTGECHILNICIHPDYQHQGFGHYLLRHVLNTAKNLGSIMAYLEVRRSNTKAINLYEKIGFAQIGDRKNYYPAAKGREDALVFAKDLRIDDEDDKS
jgi:ribosomal-protein-alanine N-acetyltransferase